MDSNHSPSNLNNKNVDPDGDFHPESKKVKFDDEAENSQVKSETKLVCEESGVLPSSPPSSEGHTDENFNIDEIAETISLKRTFELNDIIALNEPFLFEAKGGSDFWVQLKKEDADSLREKIDRVAADLKFKEMPEFVAVVGKACLCARAGSWHRAIVEEKNFPICVVRLIDMALSAEVDMEQLRPLPAVLAKDPPLAYPCMLHGVNVPNIEITRDLLENTIFCRAQILVLIKEITGNKLSVRFHDHTFKDLSFMFGIEDERIEEEQREVEETDTGTFNTLLPLVMRWENGEVLSADCHLSVLKCFNDFWLQFDPYSADELTDRISAMFEDSELTDNCERLPRVGQFCMIKTGQEWYRAAVKSVGKTTCTFHLVDHGYEVEENPMNMKKLPAALAGIPPLAFPCTLDTPVLNISEEMQKQLLKKFFDDGYPIQAGYIATKKHQLSVQLFNRLGKEFVEKTFMEELDKLGEGYVETLKCNARGQETSLTTPNVETKTFLEESQHVDRLHDSPVPAGAKDYGSPFKQSKQTIPDEWSPSNVVNTIFRAPHSFRHHELISFDCQLAHVNGSDDFWLQLDTVEVSALMSAFAFLRLEKYIDQLPRFEAGRGKACLARCAVSAAGHDVWQRATVKSISGDECRLELIDYGDETIVKLQNLRALPAAYADPPVAYRCNLDVSEFTEREVPTELLVNFFKEHRPIRAIYMGTKNDRFLVRLVNREDIFLGENLE